MFWLFMILAVIPSFHLQDAPVLLVLLLDAVSAFACFKLAQFFLREKIIVEFDEDNLYITNVKEQQERTISLDNMIKYALRPGKITMGAVWYWKHSLDFINESKQDEQIRFFVNVNNPADNDFISLARSKNPDFKYKNWSIG